MAWLTQVFPEQSIAWLLLSAIVALASGFLSSWLTYRFIKRQEIIDEATWKGEIHKEVEVYLGERAADREYKLEARKRLYKTIGPLRFQLLIACRDASSRIEGHGLRQPYSMHMKGYYGQSTLYRLLRPISISELIERQVTYADFSVDPASIDLLRFKKAAFIAFTDETIIRKHPNADWQRQREHVFSGNLSRAANTLIIGDGSNGERLMYFHEFQSFIQDSENLETFSPLPRILDDFKIAEKPIFWLRLVCLGYICSEFVRTAGRDIGFEQIEYKLTELLEASGDDYILANIEEYEELIRGVVKIGL